MTLSVQNEALVRSNYGSWVTYYIETIGEMTTSDAQGILNLQEKTIETSFNQGLTAEKVAIKILNYGK